MDSEGKLWLQWFKNWLGEAHLNYSPFLFSESSKIKSLYNASPKKWFFDSYSFFFWQLVNHNDVMSPPPPKCKQKDYCHTFFNILCYQLRRWAVYFSYMSMCPTSKEQQKYPFLTNFDYGLVYLNISYRKTNVIFRIICLSSCSKKRKLLGKNSLWLFNFKDEK